MLQPEPSCAHLAITAERFVCCLSSSLAIAASSNTPLFELSHGSKKIIKNFYELRIFFVFCKFYFKILWKIKIIKFFSYFK